MWISMANIIDGKQIAANIRQKLAQRIKEKGIKAGLAVVLVGDNPASILYVSMKEKAAIEVGISSYIHRLPSDSTEDELLALIKALNNDKRVNGILVQLPIPKHINEGKILNTIEPKKDVDGLHPINVGRLMLGQTPYFIPCTPAGIMELIASTGQSISGMNAVVIGRSNIVGKPVAQLLMQRNATVTNCHTKTRDIKSYTLNADILVAAAGRAKMVTKDMVKPGAIVIDVGTNKTDQGLVGDVDFENVKEVAGYITPVPKGVGPMTIAMLLSNCVKAAEMAD